MVPCKCGHAQYFGGDPSLVKLQIDSTERIELARIAAVERVETSKWQAFASSVPAACTALAEAMRGIEPAQVQEAIGAVLPLVAPAPAPAPALAPAPAPAPV